VDKPDLGAIFSEALAEAVSTVTGVYLDCGPPEDDTCFEELTGVMSLRGSKGGVLFISANEPCIWMLCSGMTGVPENELSIKDIEDALCEFVNMTAGSAKLRLSDPDYMFALSTPFIIRGKDVTIATKSSSQAISRVLRNGGIFLKLIFVA